jgi:hypothetical protein
MIRDADAERYFSKLSAHSDVAEEFRRALNRLGDYEVRGRGDDFPALYAVTQGLIFGAAAGMDDTYWRLRPRDVTIALATGASVAAVGPGWVQITLFRGDWPKPDIAHWALRAYDYARTGK